MGRPVLDRAWQARIEGWRVFHQIPITGMVAWLCPDLVNPTLRNCMLQRSLKTVALAALLASFAQAAFAAPQVLSACQPATSNPTSKSLLAAAQRHLGDQPDALPHLHTEGTLPNHGIREQSIAAEKDWPVMRQAALA